MHDSDDYFTDDIVFDEQTLAALDEEEHKYVQSSRISQNSPPAKRRKTDHAWRASGSTLDSLNDLEDLPEISVQNDGSYGVSGSRAANVVSNTTTWRRGVTNSRSPPVVVAPSAGRTLNAAIAPTARAPHVPAQPSGPAPPPCVHSSSQNQPQQLQGTSLLSPGLQPLPRQPPSADALVEELRKQMEEVCIAHSFQHLSNTIVQYMPLSSFIRTI